MPEIWTRETKVKILFVVALLITVAAALLSANHRNYYFKRHKPGSSIKAAIHAQSPLESDESGEKVVKIQGTFTVLKKIRNSRLKSFHLPPEEVLAQIASAKVRGLKRRTKRYACWHSCFGPFRKKVYRLPYTNADPGLPVGPTAPQSGPEGIRAKKSPNALDYFLKSSSVRPVTPRSHTRIPPQFVAERLSLLKGKNPKVNLKPVNLTVVERQTVEPVASDESEIDLAAANEADVDVSPELSESAENTNGVSSHVQQQDYGDGIDIEDLEEDENLDVRK